MARQSPARPLLRTAVLQVLPGPSIEGWYDCLRVVLEHDADLSAQDLHAAQRRLNGFPHHDRLPRPLKAEIRESSAAGIFAAVAQALQQAARHHAQHHQCAALTPTTSEVVLEVMTPETAKPLATLALALTRVACAAQDAPEWDDPLWESLDDLRPRTSHFHAQDRLQAARRMGVHCEMGAGLHRAQYRVGQGPWSRLMANAYSATTSHLGKDLAGDKIRSMVALARAGLPVPRQYRVDSAAEAAQQAQALGFPVVLKPAGSRASQGVFTMLQDAEAVRRIYQQLADDHGQVIVEKQIQGADYRLLVIGGQYVAAARRLHPDVVGDGRSTIAQLMHQSNRDLGRDGIFLAPIEPDAEVLQTLASSGRSLDQIPGVGERVVLRHAACPPSLAQDVTDIIHPSIARLAEQAASAVQLDFAGIDLVCADASRHWSLSETAIVEINAGPGLDINRYPDEGEPRPVAEAILRQAIPAGTDGSIPVVAVMGRYGKQQCAEMACTAMRLSGIEARVADNLRDPFPADLHSYQGSIRSWAGARAARSDLQGLVLPLPWRALVREGLPLQRFTVTILTDDGGDFDALAAQWQMPNVRERLYRTVCDSTSAGIIFDGNLPALQAATAHLPAAARMPCVVVETIDTLPDWLRQHCDAGGEAFAMVARAADNTVMVYLLGRRTQSPLVEHGPADADPQAPLKPAAPPSTRALCQSLAMLRLMDHGVDSLRWRAALLTGAQVQHPTTANAPWTLCVASERPDAAAPLLQSLEPSGEQALVVRCSDDLPTRQCMQAWRALLADRPARWQLTAASPNGPDAPSLARHWTQVEAQPMPSIALPPDGPGRHPAVPVLQLVTGLHAPVLHHTVASGSRHLDADQWAKQAGTVWIGQSLTRAWRIEDVALEGEPVHGRLAVIPGQVNRYRDINDIETRTRAALAAGAAAVMSAVMPPELPRWTPMLRSEDPGRSLRQVAAALRSRWQCPVVALLHTDASAQVAARLARHLDLALDPVFTNAATAGNPLGPAVAVARAGPECAGLLLPIAWREEDMAWAQPTQWIVLARDHQDLQRLQRTADLTQGGAVTIVGLPQALQAPCDAWWRRHQPTARPIRFVSEWPELARPVDAA